MKMIRNSNHEKFNAPGYVSRNAVLVRMCPTCNAQYVITVKRGYLEKTHERVFCLLSNGELTLVSEGKASFSCKYCGKICEI